MTAGTGWPSFWEPVSEDAVADRPDNTLFMKRTESVCANCGAHLSHVFPDGPPPTGLRYCMNGTALTLKRKWRDGQRLMLKAPSGAPQAVEKPFSDTYHNITRSDPYAWLRDDNWQKVMKDRALDADIRAHLEAENAYTDKVMAPTLICKSNYSLKCVAAFKKMKAACRSIKGRCLLPRAMSKVANTR